MNNICHWTFLLQTFYIKKGMAKVKYFTLLKYYTAYNLNLMRVCKIKNNAILSNSVTHIQSGKHAGTITKKMCQPLFIVQQVLKYIAALTTILN
jgi:hypothetical protein